MCWKERRIFMADAVLNRYGNKFCNEMNGYLPNRNLTKDNMFYKIKRNYDITSKIKMYARNEEYIQYINENIVRNAKIRNGYPTIKGTRITPDDIFALACKKEFDVEIILKEYPSLRDEKQVLFIILYCLNKKIKNPVSRVQWIFGI